MAKYKIVNTTANVLQTKFGRIVVASVKQDTLKKLYEAGSIYVALDDIREIPKEEKPEKTKTK